MTRYKEAHRFKIPLSKPKRFVLSGGVGSFAHEYGHFLDYFFGGKTEIITRSVALTNGRSTDPRRIPYNRSKMPMRSLMEDIMEKAYWAKGKQADSNYVKRIKDAVPPSYLDYFLRRNEIFARLFEQYISHKLKGLKIQNVFLTKTKYHSAQYMTPTEMKAIVPLMDKLLVEMRKYF